MAKKKKEEVEQTVEDSEKEQKKKEPPKFVLVTGKRKKAIARAIIKPGKGLVKVNSVPLDLVTSSEMVRLKMTEPLILAGDAWKSFDISVNVSGGGSVGQAEAVRQSIAKGLVEYLPDLKKTYSEYDRNLLVFDSRRTEPHKPGPSEPRAHKQRSKR